MYLKPVFSMLVGVPGSGKSTYAKEKLKTESSTKYFSSDAIRAEIYGDENCQDDPNRVFTLMQERTLEALKNGYNVIYDATNITRKNRKRILDRLPSYVHKSCIIVWAPIDECIRRDLQRDRTVGEAVIWKMLKCFEAPFYDEGFNEIVVEISNYPDPVEYYNRHIEALEIPHDNPNHSADIAEHCRICAKNLENQDIPDIVKFAGRVHDIGKPLTKSFTNMKGEVTDIAHYYGHHAVGAWISYGFLSDNPVLAWLISTHMAPFVNQKYYSSLDPLYKKWIDILHAADLAAK